MQQQANGQPNIDCDGLANGNSGCGVTEWSRASYGPSFDAQGGGVFAMKWDETGIAVCTYTTAFSGSECPILRHAGSFYRAAVPQDILISQPNPNNWGVPVALLEPGGCDPISNFVNHSIVFGEFGSLEASARIVTDVDFRYHILRYVLQIWYMISSDVCI